MRKISSVLLIAATLCIAVETSAQGNTAIPFLLISPSAEMNGMGQASVALSTNDPFAFTMNPAQLGAQSVSNYFSAGHNYSEWLPAFNLSDLWLRTSAVTAGVNLKKLRDYAPPLSFGVGYSRTYLNLGNFVVTSEIGPEIVRNHKSSEAADQYGVGVNLDYWVRLSAGVTYKHIVSDLANVGISSYRSVNPVKVNLYDFGFLLGVPVVDIVSKLSDNTFEVVPHLAPYADLSVGISKNNLGQAAMTYTGAPQSDMLPRFAHAGLAIELGATYDDDGLVWKPCSFKWTIESGCLLVGQNKTYKTGLGDINFFDQVIFGKTNKETEIRKGWELSALEIVAIRGGRFEEDVEHGNRRFDSWGWGVQTTGVTKLLRALDVPIETEGIVGFLMNNIHLSYNHSEWTTDEANSPLRGTKFDYVGLTIVN